MTTDDIIAYYVNLLAIQYKTQPNARGTIAALATQVVASQIYSQVLEGFAIPTAVGKQLDILADYVGAPREIFGYDPTIPYFALTDYSQVPAANVGFADYSDIAAPIDNWLSYTTAQTTFVLTEGQLRQLVAYLIAVHASDHTLASIDIILQTFFGSYCALIDNEDMTITYQHQIADPSHLFLIINQINALPHPAGVQVIVTEV